MSLAVGDHCALLCRWASDGEERLTKFAWKVIAIDPDDPRNIRIENCRGGRMIVDRQRLKLLEHREWISEPSWLQEENFWKVPDKCTSTTSSESTN